MKAICSSKIGLDKLEEMRFLYYNVENPDNSKKDTL